jgi:hypothetical protein
VAIGSEQEVEGIGGGAGGAVSSNPTLSCGRLGPLANGTAKRVHVIQRSGCSHRRGVGQAMHMCRLVGACSYCRTILGREGKRG